MIRILFILLFFNCFGNISVAQDTIAQNTENVVQYDIDSEQQPVSFDANKIEDFKNDSDFNYTEEEVNENWWTKFLNWLSNLWSRFWNWVFDGVPPGPFWSFVVRVLPYVIIGLAIAFIIWIFYKLNPGASIFKSKKKPGVYFTEEEEIIKSKNIQKLIDKAIAAKNYRLAVRYYYLLILKKLTDYEIIDYEFDKTNTDYIAEISSDILNLQFSKVTNLYDYIWYGNFVVTEEDYQKAQRTFIKLEQSLNNLKPETVE